MNSSSVRPFAKKSFFLDLKGFAKEDKLVKDLKLLGGKHATCLDKTVSFVVSNRISVKPQFGKPTTPLSNPRSMSPHLFNDSTLDGIGSPSNIGSPGIERNPTIMFRSQSLMQMSREKALAKKQSGTTDVVEICKQFNIKMYHVQKVTSWVDKYKLIYYKNHVAKQKDDLKSQLKSYESSQKIHAPFIKIEDEKRKFKTRYKVLSSWTDIVDPALSQFVSQMRKDLKVSGSINNFLRPTLKNMSTNPIQSFQSVLPTRSVSFTKISGNNASNSVSVCAPNDGGKENCFHNNSKRKGKESKKKSKRRYCEICDVQFTDIDTHLEKKAHERFMNNAKHYEVVEDIISSLPSADDFMASLLQVEEKVEKNICEDYFFKDAPTCLSDCGIHHEKESFMVNAESEMENCMTEVYSVNPDDYISASCSSTCTTPLPFLEYAGCNMNKLCDDLDPPTLVYFNTFETMHNPFESDSFVMKSALPFQHSIYEKPLETSNEKFIENIIAGILDEGNNTTTVCNRKLEGNYGTGSNSCDVHMEDVENQVQVSAGISHTLGGEIKTNESDLSVMNTLKNNSKIEHCSQMTPACVDYSYISNSIDNLSIMKENTYDFPSLLPCANLDIMNQTCTEQRNQDSCTRLLLPELSVTNASFEMCSNLKDSNNNVQLNVQKELSVLPLDITFSKVDHQHNATGISIDNHLSKQNKICLPPHVISTPTIDVINDANQASADSNNNEVKNAKSKEGCSSTTSRNLIFEFESVTSNKKSESWKPDSYKDDLLNIGSVICEPLLSSDIKSVKGGEDKKPPMKQNKLHDADSTSEMIKIEVDSCVEFNHCQDFENITKNIKKEDDVNLNPYSHNTLSYIESRSPIDTTFKVSESGVLNLCEGGDCAQLNHFSNNVCSEDISPVEQPVLSSSEVAIPLVSDLNQVNQYEVSDDVVSVMEQVLSHLTNSVVKKEDLNDLSQSVNNKNSKSFVENSGNETEVCPKGKLNLLGSEFKTPSTYARESKNNLPYSLSMNLLTDFAKASTSFTNVEVSNGSLNASNLIKEQITDAVNESLIPNPVICETVQSGIDIKNFSITSFEKLGSTIVLMPDLEKNKNMEIYQSFSQVPRMYSIDESNMKPHLNEDGHECNLSKLVECSSSSNSEIVSDGTSRHSDIFFSPFKNPTSKNRSFKPLLFEKFVAHLKVPPETASEIWDSNDVYFVVDDVNDITLRMEYSEIADEKICSSVNHSLHLNAQGDAVNVCTEGVSFFVNHNLNLNAQSAQSSDGSTERYNGLVGSTVSAGSSAGTYPLTIAPAIDSTQNVENSIHSVFVDSPSTNQLIFNEAEKTVLNSKTHNLSLHSVSGLNGSSQHGISLTCSEEMDFSSSPEKEKSSWDAIHHEVNSLCKSISADEECAMDLSMNCQRFKPPALLMQY